MEPSEICFARGRGNCVPPRTAGERRALRVDLILPCTVAGFHQALRYGGLRGLRPRWMGWAYAQWLRRVGNELPTETAFSRRVPFVIRCRARACFNHGMEAFGLFPIRDQATGEWFFVGPALRFGMGVRATALVTVPDEEPRREA